MFSEVELRRVSGANAPTELRLLCLLTYSLTLLRAYYNKISMKLINTWINITLYLIASVKILHRSVTVGL